MRESFLFATSLHLPFLETGGACSNLTSKSRPTKTKRTSQRASLLYSPPCFPWFLELEPSRPIAEQVPQEGVVFHRWRCWFVIVLFMHQLFYPKNSILVGGDEKSVPGCPRMCLPAGGNGSSAQFSYRCCAGVSVSSVLTLRAQDIGNGWNTY